MLVVGVVGFANKYENARSKAAHHRHNGEEHRRSPSLRNNAAVRRMPIYIIAFAPHCLL